MVRLLIVERLCELIAIESMRRFPRRRVVRKTEYLAKGENPRFIVTSLSRQEQDARGLYNCGCTSPRLCMCHRNPASLGAWGTELAQAQCDTIRLQLLKIGAQIRTTVRNVWIAFSEAYPYANLFQTVLARVQQNPLRG
ncbi:MAG: transposase [Burkholderiales bacterium]